MTSLSNEVFRCEHLGFDVRINQKINNFKVKQPNAINLAKYLSNYATADESMHTNRTYLVLDKCDKEIACYFSLRNGLFTLPTKAGTIITIPAVELSNFAVNDDYKAKHPGLGRIGSTVLKDFIFPLVKQVQEISGVGALYIYALPDNKLIEHYTTLGFSRLSSDEELFIHNRVKPTYDDGCIFMCQGV